MVLGLRCFSSFSREILLPVLEMDNAGFYKRDFRFIKDIPGFLNSWPWSSQIPWEREAKKIPRMVGPRTTRGNYKWPAVSHELHLLVSTCGFVRWQKRPCRCNCNWSYSSADMKMRRLAWMMRVGPVFSHEPLEAGKARGRGSHSSTKPEKDSVCQCWLENEWSTCQENGDLGSKTARNWILPANRELGGASSL